MDEAEKRKHIELVRKGKLEDTCENLVIKLLTLQIVLLADISETLLDMQKEETGGKINERSRY